MGRAAARLTQVEVNRLSKRAGMHCDGGGLYLRVVLPNECSWIFRYQIAGRARSMGLGPFPEITLSEARAKALEARKLKIGGNDPIEARRAKRAAKALEDAKSVTFRQAAESFVRAHASGWKNQKHAAQWPSTLQAYAYPVIGELPVGAIDRSLIIRLLEPIWLSKPETARRLRGRIEQILDWSTVRGHREGENPARLILLKRGLPKQPKDRGHHAALPYSELPAFMDKLRQQDGIAARSLEFAILCVSRTGEAIGGRWSEIDWDKQTWEIEAGRMKGGKAHIVPLAPRALAILREMKAEGDTIFAGARHGRPLSNMAFLMLLRRMGRGDLTAHGFRSSFRDWAGDKTSFDRETIEFSLAHGISDKTEAAYRRATAIEKRRKLMAAWADYCASPPRQPEENVIDLGRASRA